MTHALLVPHLESPFTHLAAYQFGALENLRDLRDQLQKLTHELSLKGTILLSHEGINLFVAGSSEALAAVLNTIRTLPGFESFNGKYNPCDQQPYNRMLVRLKKEIISFGIEGIQPALHTSPKLEPHTLKQWLDEGRPITLLDTRNDYEVKLGTFHNALTLDIHTFREFPEAVRKLPENLKNEPVVMFCTGGIRCEKAGPFMEKEGFKQIYQLQGGILKYFEDCDGAHYDGECFVFDQRTGVDPSLRETDTTLCYRCQSPLSKQDQDDPRYVINISCPHCFRPPEEERRLALQARRAKLREVTHPLPGSLPADNFRPLTVPATCDGKVLMDFLCHILPHAPKSRWMDLWNQNCLVDDQHHVIPLDQPLRAGFRCLQRQPSQIEPPVNADVELLAEDEALIVLNKPAPLAMHPGGRFSRNTLQHFLNLAFAPLKPRPSHRLDANTTGVVIFTKTRHFAGLLQPQFSAGTVEKSYITRVHGHPPTDDFVCEASISDEVGRFGTRSIDETWGRQARTEFHILRRDTDGTALIRAVPMTGRTHQIRLHLWHLGFPIQGDPAYLPNHRLGNTQTLSDETHPLCLHAESITISHPISGDRITFSATLPSWADEVF